MKLKVTPKDQRRKKEKIILISEDVSLYDLAEKIVSEYKSVKRTQVKDVWKNTGDQMLFLFDYGDCLEWIVESL